MGDTGDFIIGEPVEGFFDAAGIESPGLTSAPAIGEYLCGLISERIGLEEDPAYGSIVCRCEGITEGEILDAIHRTLGATTLDGVKRRTRAGMGRCGAYRHL